MSTSPLLKTPEILLLVVHFLPQSTLLSCTGVSKFWYQTLRPLAWQKIHLGISVSRQPALKTVLKHKNYVKSLHISPTSALGCSLTSQTWEVITQLSEIKSLTIHKVSFEEDTVNFLWDLCERVERLDCSFVSIAGKGNLESRSFSNIRKLRFDGDLAGFNQVHVMSRCPNLTSLVWPIGLVLGEPIDQFVQLAVRGTWPALESMSRAQFLASDNDLAFLLKSLRQVTEWSAVDIGPKSFQALQGHFATLTAVGVSLSFSLLNSTATAAMLQEILTSCPLLETLRWGSVNADGILGDQPWACTRLRSLTMSVMFGQDERDHLQPLLFERLSKLTSLENLDFGVMPIVLDTEHPTAVDNQISSGSPVSIRMGRGIEKLATLRSLCNIVFVGITQIGKTDEEGMLELWPNSEFIVGQVMDNENDPLYDLGMLMASGGVCYFRYRLRRA
ncbi:hypothetical protein BGZ99_000268 [Dissophora globulifera]|uniref:F-box domain-containing protein n=1 Tax=Dissophora globulifera TaxID=979702 RepID=A0A9P6R2J8_9FUNG|nr:hypothetical protein BGZ99_000268 [Dissophora globulifera]